MVVCNERFVCVKSIESCGVAPLVQAFLGHHYFEEI